MALSSIHVGKQATSSPNDVDNPVIKTPDGTPYIPGSSLKGVLRCENDRLMNSLAEIMSKPDLEVCDLEENRQACGKCISCILFGGEQASSIRVKDFIGTTKKTFKRDGVSISRKTRKAIKGAKYDIEVVPRGSKFNGVIFIENPRIEEYKYAKLGALLSLINFFNNTNRSVGGATSRGFGEVLIVPKEVRSYTPKDYLEATNGKTILTFTPEEVSERPYEWKLNCVEQEKLKEILKDWTELLKSFKKSE